LIGKIRQGRFDVVIAVEKGDVLLYDLGGARKIFYPQSPTAHEMYFSAAHSLGPFDIEAYRDATRAEITYYEAADVVIFAWNTHVDYVKKHVYKGTNIVSHPGLGWFGCTPQPHRARYVYPPLIAYMGL